MRRALCALQHLTGHLNTRWREKPAPETIPTGLPSIYTPRGTLNAHSCSTLQMNTRPAQNGGGPRLQGNLLRGLATEAALGPRTRSQTAFQLKPVFEV